MDERIHAPSGIVHEKQRGANKKQKQKKVNVSRKFRRRPRALLNLQGVLTIEKVLPA